MLLFLLRARCRTALLAALTCVGLVATARAEVVDRVLAVVGGHPITLSDVRAAIDLGLVDVAGADDPASVALAALVDRRLMLSDVERYGPEAPPQAAVDAAVANVRTRLGDERYRAALARGGLTDSVLAVVLRDDLRIEAYVLQRFGAAAQPTEDEVAREYTLRRDALAVDGRVPTFDEAAPRLSAQLAAERRDAQVADWLAGLRRRTEVRVLDAPGAPTRQ